MPYQALNPERITQTVVTLRNRIDERFPESGLSNVAGELIGLSEKAHGTMEEVSKPILWIRVSSFLLVALIIVGLAVMFVGLGGQIGAGTLTFIEYIQVLEAGINDVVLIGLAVFFLVSLERRQKRKRLLAALHELRSMAHIVDMHQLTKDPSHAIRPDEGHDTPSSPRRTLSVVNLERYLDYCSEMLSLIGKIAALYVQRWDDDVVLAAVNEVEALTTGLSGKIWQKMMILETVHDD